MAVTIQIEAGRLASGEVPTAIVEAQVVPRVEEYVEFMTEHGEVSGHVQSVLHSFLDDKHSIYVRLR